MRLSCLKVPRSVIGAFLGATLPLHASSSFAQPSDPPPAVRVAQLSLDIQIDAAGVAVTHGRYDVAVTNEAAAPSVGTGHLYYREESEAIEVTEAFTLKSDGRHIEVPSDHVLTQMVPGRTENPTFDDLRQKVIIFPDVHAGDRVVYTWNSTARPAIPGAFDRFMSFPRILPYDDVVVTITAPASIPLNFDTVGGSISKTLRDKSATYIWRYSAPQPVSSPAKRAIALTTDIPHFSVSTFRNYDELARAYAGLLRERSHATPGIAAKVAELTRGMTDHRAKAEALYKWVAQNVRYVSVDLGNDGIIPHEPGVTLANGYGDCKDKAALLSAMLGAAGISSEIVLLNVITYDLPKAPGSYAFNHAILWVPEFQLYVDATDGLGAFGTLPFPEYGKQALHVVSANALRRIPPLSETNATTNVISTSYVDADDNVSGHSEVTGTGPFATHLRGIAMAVQARGAEWTTRNILGGTDGYVVAFAADNADILASSYTIRMRFPTRGFGAGRLTGSPFWVPPGERIFDRAGEGLMGPMEPDVIPDTEPTPCYSVSMHEELTLYPPPRHVIGRIPHDTDIQTPYIEYHSRWHRTGNGVSVTRNFKSHVTDAVCSGAVRASASEDMARVRKDYEQTMTMKPAWDDASTDQVDLSVLDDAIAKGGATEIVWANRGTIHALNKEYDQAILDFDRAIEANPAYVHGHILRGQVRKTSVDARSLSQAKDDFSEAIRLDPGRERAYVLRGETLAGLKQYEEAMADLNHALGINEKDAEALAARGHIFIRLKKYQQAVADFDAGLALFPDNARLLELRGVAYDGLKNYPKALADYRRVSDLNPAHPDIKVMIAEDEHLLGAAKR